MNCRQRLVTCSFKKNISFQSIFSLLENLQNSIIQKLEKFVISSNPVDCLRDLRCESVPFYNYFYYHSDLRWLKVQGSKSGNFYYLIGRAIQTEPDAPEPETILREERFTQIEDTIASWSGRYVLITPAGIYNDALSMMRLFYTSEADNKLISNNLALIHRSCDTLTMRKSFDENSVVIGKIFDWFPGPGTIFKEVFCVMVDYHIQREGEYISVVRNTHIDDNLYAGKTTERLVDLLENRIKTYFYHLNRTFRHIIIPLSGGYDSRTLISYALKFGIPFSSYTFHKKTISPHDRLLPRKICRDMQIPTLTCGNITYPNVKSKKEPYA